MKREIYQLAVIDLNSYLPLDVSTEELTLGNVHSVPGHSQPQLLGIGDSISGKTLLIRCETQTHNPCRPDGFYNTGSTQVYITEVLEICVFCFVCFIWSVLLLNSQSVTTNKGIWSYDEAILDV